MKILSVMLVSLILGASLISGSYAWAEVFDLEGSLGLGILRGSTLYHISGVASGIEWASELEWPVNAALAEANLAWRGSPWSFEVSLGKNLSKDTGEMKDSDWFFGEKQVYSESDTSMEALFIDAGATYNLIRGPKWDLAVKGGYKYQNFSFSAKDLDQWYPLEPEKPHDVVAGTVIDYKATYNIPYLGVVVEGQPSEKLHLKGGLLLGMVSAKDEDDHILRYKLSKGSTSGSALFFSLEGRYNFSSRMFTKLSVEMADINTSGEQDQRFYAGEDEGVTFEDIDDEIKSNQTLFSWMLGFLL